MVYVSIQFYLSQLLEISRVSSGKDASEEDAVPAATGGSDYQYI
jgi:hypothetical protein